MTPGPVAFVVLGEPLSVNRLYRSVAGRSIKSREGRVYHAHFVGCAVVGRIKAGGQGAIPGPVSVTLRFFFGSERPDIDGPIKIALDAMEVAKPKRDGAGVYVNDRQVRRLLVERFVDRSDPRVEVRVEPLAVEAPSPKPKRKPRLPKTSAFGASCRVPLVQDPSAASRREQAAITRARNALRPAVRSYRGAP